MGHGPERLHDSLCASCVDLDPKKLCDPPRVMESAVGQKET